MSAPTDTVANLAAYVDQLAALNNLTVPVSPPPPPTTPTGGSWVGIVGADGYVLPGIGLALPSGQTVTPGPKSDYTWATATTDTRGVQTPDGSARKAACWYSGTSFYVDVNAGNVSLYCMDWDNQSRSQRIDVLDSATGTVLDTITLSGFRSGIWVAYNVTKPVRFQFTKLTGPNAVLSAICFGGTGTPPPLPAPPPPPPPPPPPLPVPGALNITINFVSGITPSQQSIFQAAAARWQQIIIEPNRSLTITAQGQTIDGTGGILGSGAPSALDATRGLPVSGMMSFDSADLTWAENNNYLLDIITHEMGHVLGFGTIGAWNLLVSGLGGTDPEFTGPKATAAYNARFNKTGTSVPVEGGSVPGTAGVHWRDSVFGRELMTGYYNAGQVNPISAVTVGAMADLGWNVNAAGAEAYLTAAGFVAGEHDAYRVTPGLSVVGHDPSRVPHPRKRHKVTR